MFDQQLNNIWILLVRIFKYLFQGDFISSLLIKIMELRQNNK